MAGNLPLPPARSRVDLQPVVLAAIGIYGVVACTVTRRRRDVSIRLALGASRASVVRFVARGMVIPVAFGIVAGLVGARTLSRTLAGFMYGVTGSEPGTYVFVAAVLALIAVCATFAAGPVAAANPVDAMQAD